MEVGVVDGEDDERALEVQLSDKELIGAKT
jgi:hypothetical protein